MKLVAARNKTGNYLVAAMVFLLIAFHPMEVEAQTSGSGKSGLPLPRFVSLKSGKVNLRIGPGRDFKIDWLYQKQGLPMEIIREFDNWRKVRDPEGNEGWVLHSLLSGRRTVVVQPWETDRESNLTDLRSEPSKAAALAAKLQPGVIANVKSCSDDWCQLLVEDSKGASVEGYAEKNFLWGVYPDEFIEE